MAYVPDRGDESGYTAFHVARAAAVHLAVNDLARKRIDAPGSVPKRNRIDVAGKTQRKLAADSAYSCN